MRMRSLATCTTVKTKTNSPSFPVRGGMHLAWRDNAHVISLRPSAEVGIYRSCKICRRRAEKNAIESIKMSEEIFHENFCLIKIKINRTNDNLVDANDVWFYKTKFFNLFDLYTKEEFLKIKEISPDKIHLLNFKKYLLHLEKFKLKLMNSSLTSVSLNPKNIFC